MSEDSNDNFLYESMDEINNTVGEIQESLQEYFDSNSDKSQIISLINDLRVKLDDIEDNL